jgi:hypothetical protein
VLEFRVRPRDTKLEASRGKFDEFLATEKGKRQRFFHEYIKYIMYIINNIIYILQFYVQILNTSVYFNSPSFL